MRKLFIALVAFSTLLATFTITQPQAASASASVSFTADIWADNWFALYVNGKKVAEDSVPITTTKSFNKQTVVFTASYPLVIGIVGKDYVENESGLEYIGTPQQQIGDGGLIAQIKETKSKKLVAATNKNWKFFLVNKAPTNPSCSTSVNPKTDCKFENHSVPSNWSSTSYSTSKWTRAVEYSEAQVGPKEGYFEIEWDAAAHLIWSSSLTLDNVVLFRTRVEKSPVSAAPSTKQSTGANATASANFTLTAPGLIPANQLSIDNSCDGKGTSPALSWQGAPAATKSFALLLDTVPGPARPGETMATDFNHWVLYGIPAATKSIAQNATVGAQGKNFKGTIGYTPPCSQGPGLKTYTAHLYALSSSVNFVTAPTGIELLKAIQPLTLAEAKLDLTYTRK
jgi:phosphatidylethanolamine-binding protein (PEBP) family uncharacterized protein